MAALAVACAVEVPPSGGPEDKVGPTVASTTPTRDSTGVDTSSAVVITFSEAMTRARVERSVIFEPPITFGRVDWRGQSLVIHPMKPLQGDTTYVVRVLPGYRDHHGVPSRARYEFAFATGAVLDTARIEGVVSFKHRPAAKAVVRCFRLPKGPDFDPLGLRPDREAAAAKDGTYRLRYLAENNARYVVMAFIDANGNETFDRDTEPSAVFPDTLVLTPQRPVLTGIDITVIDPNEPGTIDGVVANETGIDTLRVSVSVFAVNDTTRAVHYTHCDTTGAFRVEKVKPGDYLVQAFLDLHADSLRDTWNCPDTTGTPCVEPYVWYPDTVAVKPAQTVNLRRIVLRKREGP